MDNLKTLKDIDILRLNNPMGLSSEILRQLRDEAQKYLDSDMLELAIFGQAFPENPDFMILFIKDFIRYFFNIGGNK